MRHAAPPNLLLRYTLTDLPQENPASVDRKWDYGGHAGCEPTDRTESERKWAWSHYCDGSYARVNYQPTLRSPATPGRLPGIKVHMQSLLDGLSSRPRVVIADEDPSVVQFVIRTLRKDGNAVFHAYDALSAVQLAFSLDRCDLLISNTRVEGLPGVELIQQLRSRLPNIPVLYVANIGRSTPELEAKLPPGVPILREPFTAEELLAAVRPFVSDGRH